MTGAVPPLELGAEHFRGCTQAVFTTRSGYPRGPKLHTSRGMLKPGSASKLPGKNVTAVPVTAPPVIGAVMPSGLLCCVCGADRIVSIWPGHEAQAFGNDLFTYERGAAVRGWCPACWPTAHSSR